MYTCECNYNSLKRSSSSPKSRKSIIIKNWASYSNYINETNNTQTDNAKYVNIIILMYNFVIIILKHLEVYGITTEMNYI